MDERDLTPALLDGWGITAGELEYLPVGAGSYHWAAGPWFVKVDDLGVDAPSRVFEDLRRSLTVALRLGLACVVAPVVAVDGSVVHRLGDRFAVAVFPLVAGVAGEFGPHRAEDLGEVARLLAQVHGATPAVVDLAPRADLRLPGRGGLEEALRTVEVPWTGGPFAERARAVLRRHAGLVRDWLAEFDRLVAGVRGTSAGWVVTHGEPHPGNVLRTADGLRLIDWTTVQIAPPERDLWMLGEGLEVYTAEAGREGSPMSPRSPLTFAGRTVAGGTRLRRCGISAVISKTEALGRPFGYFLES
ncbi:phosphotransferase [Actinoplanes awajinensis]|uniref:phosphotransferase n=1 Tax=Actinoplanes awajinensis TaxID=135946 RepID=UPI001E3E01DF|nr:phosphotransferase [Actinoplanes awajinensis]